MKGCGLHWQTCVYPDQIGKNTFLQHSLSKAFQLIMSLSCAAQMTECDTSEKMISPPLGVERVCCWGASAVMPPWDRGQMLAEWLCITEEGSL